MNKKELTTSIKLNCIAIDKKYYNYLKGINFHKYSYVLYLKVKTCNNLFVCQKQEQLIVSYNQNTNSNLKVLNSCR